MTVLSPLFLLFGLAAAVPLILHLYQQRQRTVLLYSTNRFFTQSIVRSQRRMRIRRILLLLLRMAACLFLALAAAQPLLSFLGLGSQAGSRDVVILLDDSLSMQAPAAAAPGGPTHFDRAKELALGLLGELGGGDRAAVLTSTGKAFGRPTAGGVKLSADIAGLVAQIQALTPTSAAGDDAQALDHAAEIYDTGGRRTRVLLALSDFQASDWPPAGSWPQPAQPTDLIMVHVGPPPLDHLAPQAMTLTQGTAVAGQPDLLTVRIVNFGSAGAAGDLVVAVDGQEQARRALHLSGQSSVAESVPITFDAAGDHCLTARVTRTPADSLPQDGDLYAAVHVVGEVPLLLIDGQSADPHTARRQSPAFYLRAAMLALGHGGGASANDVPNRTGASGSLAAGTQEPSIRPDTISPPDLTHTPRLDIYRVIALANVRSLPPDQVERLRDFVRGGGGLAVFLGDQCDPKFYHDQLGPSSDSAGGLLPADLLAPVGIEESGLAGEPMHLLQTDTNHPTLARFSGALRGALAGIDIYRVWEVQPRDAWVYAGLEGNRPFLLERNYGRGKTILCTTIPTPAWTNMPLRRVFVTWIGQTVSYLAGGRVRPADWEVGRDLPLPAPDSAGDQPVRVRTPDGNTQISDIRLVGAQPQPYLPAAAVTLPGFYRVSSTDTVERVRPAAIPAPGQAGGDEGFDPHHQVVAVNVPRSESLPAVLDFERAAHDSGRWRVHRAEPPAPDAHADATAHALLTGRQVSLGLWDYLLWTVLALVLIEPLIANRLAGSTPGPNDTFGAVPATWRRRMRRWRTGLPWKTAATAGARSGAVSLKD